MAIVRSRYIIPLIVGTRKGAIKKGITPRECMVMCQAAGAHAKDLITYQKHLNALVRTNKMTRTKGVRNGGKLFFINEDTVDLKAVAGTKELPGTAKPKRIKAKTDPRSVAIEKMRLGFNTFLGGLEDLLKAS